MRRFFSVFLVVALLCGLLGGCGGTKTDGAQTDAETAEPKQEQPAVWTDGVVSDGVYTNECLGLTFQLPDGWLEASDEETRTILNADPNDASTTYDTLLGTINMDAKMYLLRMDLRQQIGGSKLTEDAAIEAFLADIDGEVGAPETVTLCGRDYRGVVVVDRGLGVYQQVLFSRFGDSDMILLGVMAMSPELLAYYLAHFTEDPATLPAPPATAEAAAPTAFSRGTIEDSAYVSAYLGLRFSPPEDWLFASDEELATLMGLSMDAIGEEVFGDSAELAKKFAMQTTIYDMAATAPDRISNVQISLENLAASIGGTALSETDYADILCNQLTSITDYTYTFGAYETQEIAGKTFTLVPAALEDYGILQYFYLLRHETYMLLIVSTGRDESIQEYTDYFSAI